MKFCSECRNLLDPEEDKERRQLVFRCKRCNIKEATDPDSAAENTIERRNINYESKEEVFIRREIVEDNTLSRTKDHECPKCRYRGAVFFQLPEKSTDQAMTLVFVCENCGHWVRGGRD
ncbi:unnamed protein product [Vitrella brassicaformis CCMP3155]|uniref:DNA-directed RNA polymerase subunit n=2 Tax=Vitrella brassicaformis TaxID=1169539 RepID=A0A0G4GWI1_VITBC|nr:unnamed protein product [Vitrella brassicaformis CCMP3155]|eukprot:CEM35336.1 unnamed protein product [Vitrella brassicaformis CCMP3155]